MSTDTPEVRPLPEAPKPPTLDDALSHLVYLDAVNVATFKEWATLNPGGVCVLIRALIARLPVTTQQYFPVYDSLNPPPTDPLEALPAKWRKEAGELEEVLDMMTQEGFIASQAEVSMKRILADQLDASLAARAQDAAKGREELDENDIAAAIVTTTDCDNPLERSTLADWLQIAGLTNGDRLNFSLRMARAVLARALDARREEEGARGEAYEAWHTAVESAGELLTNAPDDRYRTRAKQVRDWIESHRPIAPRVACWRGLNWLGEVVTEWIDGPKPAKLYDLHNNEADFDSTQYAYFAPAAATEAEGEFVRVPRENVLAAATLLEGTGNVIDAREATALREYAASPADDAGVRVPREPTRAMLDAVCSAEGIEPWTPDTMRGVYIAMIDAASTQEGG